MTPPRLDVVTIFLLFMVALVLSAKNSGALNASPTSNQNSWTNPPNNDTSVLAVRGARLTNKKRKSDHMCDEYSRQISSTTHVSLDDKCIKVNRLVVGGVNALPGEFPHMVALGRRQANGPFGLVCGGTLIAPQWVLTAAHCIYTDRLVDAVVGFHDLRDIRYGVITTLNKTIRHPKYKYPTFHYDIALIKLNTIITFNEDIKPACLYQYFGNVPLKGWVSGWGDTEFGNREASNQLQKAEVEIIDNLECLERYKNNRRIPDGITPNMFCAGDPSGGWNKDTCQGDSGGPLQIVHPKYSCLFQVVGITSFGEGCAFQKTPGVYTRVSYYLKWIEDIVWP